MTLKNTISGKTILITGATSGIGEACARKFASFGSRLILCGRRIDRLNKLRDELSTEFNVDIYAAACDITQKKEVEDFISTIPLGYKNIDVLINNAGLALGLDKMYEANISDWEKMIDTNINGLLYFTRLVLPSMVEKNAGHIVNIGSISGHGVYPKGAVYCSTKHAVRAISQGLRMDLCGFNIKVSLIEPGIVKTEFSLVRHKGDEQAAKSVYAGLQPLLPEDIAESVLYCLCSPRHVNIDEIIIMPQDQAALTMSHRRKDMD